ncbi:MAG: bifunctional phosphopantothenoylcysteine decarboxylase/phosphopantothenate--cysteine ligase CoaBC [Nitrososphaerota archaeon]|nr:bifunctional phosphopantothenoylcysteine decarboxylase/phosphopantothenate--cysteine ligase CoaBC [Candidatus Calditenuaceae archaeon]MDW8072624.1 bifunctional phosphopantothenoylcysteine decarboxylase/phosphopantothenate--cysteine ligase CoaBC [Nitrososphaerota archaeon]
MSRSDKSIRGSWGDELSGRRIAHCVTGSVSIYRTPDLARSFIRHGGDVIPVMTSDAAKLLSPQLLEWATGNQPIVEITGRVEHVELTEGEGKVDLVLVAPASANTLVKMSIGASDNPVTLVCSAALGAGIPVVVAPAMHASMAGNPAVKDALKRLEEMGVSVVAPLFEESKAKLAPEQHILEEVIYRLTPKPLKGKKFVVSAGPTREHIDQVRFISNPSSGLMGIEVARSLRMLGGQVTLILGPTHLTPPQGVETIRAVSTQEMEKAVLKAAQGSEAFFSAAAVADYKPVNTMGEKIATSTHPRITLELEATPKILESVRRSVSEIEIIPFKATYGEEKPEKILNSLSSLNPLMIVINDVSRSDIGFASPFNEVTVIGRSGRLHHLPKSRKSAIARRIIELYMEEKGITREAPYR